MKKHSHTSTVPCRHIWEPMFRYRTEDGVRWTQYRCCKCGEKKQEKFTEDTVKS